MSEKHAYELTEKEQDQLRYIASKYGNVSLKFDLSDQKVGAVFEAPLFPSACMGDIQENGFSIQEIRQGEGDNVEIVVGPDEIVFWAKAHEKPLPV